MSQEPNSPAPGDLPPVVPAGGHPLPDPDQFSPVPPLPSEREGEHASHPPAASTAATGDGKPAPARRRRRRRPSGAQGAA